MRPPSLERKSAASACLIAALRRNHSTTALAAALPLTTSPREPVPNGMSYSMG